ncbi:MAG TPA: HAD-IC family P-type ATPase, partial [Ferruginibacter sp.]|nr:HAD-IC family P-type ATPase [Ferruginibacter sp.]
VNDWIKALQSDPSGLTEADARERLKNQSGRVHSSSHWQKDLLLLLSQFRSPLMFLLIGAVVLSFFLGDSIDAIIILFILLSTGLLSFFQERNAGRVVEKLQQLIAIQSTVLRNHQAVNVPANQLVPGDIILLDAGDLIAADCLLMEANELHVNEASLTGESFPVRKESGILDAGTALAARTNCLWEGTNVISGTATALVIQTGSDTLFGKMVKSTSATEETSFEKGIRDFGYFLMKVTLVLSILILVINLLHHKPVMESALFALALAVGMAPELLPAITTIAMSAGANRMLAKKVIVKKLSSIQNLGEVNLLCTDKTGTITEGVIAIDAICDAEGQPNAEVRALAYWNALFESGYANPIDDALRAIKDKPIETVQKTGEIPYDFIRKRLSIAVNRNGQTLLISKGAFDQVLAVCQQVRMPDGQLQDLISHESAIRSRYQSFGVNGWRVIAVAYKAITKTPPVVTDEAEMIFAGFVLIQDPVKPGIRDTLR